MAEETIWRGSVSQWKNSGFFLLQLLIAIAILIVVAVLEQSGPEVRKFSVFIMLLLAVPIFIAGKGYLQTKCTVYEVTNERLKTTEGILSKVTDTLEFYRIKDIEKRQPFSLPALRNRERPAEYFGHFLAPGNHRSGAARGWS